MQYQVAYAPTIDDLEKEVAEMISDGWKPTGGVSTTVDEDGNYYFQAMIRE